VDVVEAALRWLEPYLIGADPSGVEGHGNRIGRMLWSSGIIPRAALSAIDIALWDIEGKTLGVPVWRLLGGPVQRRLRAYFSHWNRGMTSYSPEAFADRAVETLKQGWTAVKFGLGSVTGGLTESERVRVLTGIFAAIRKAVGDKLDIGLECSQALNMRTAVRLARALEPYHPFFLEEPLPRQNLAEFGELAARSPLPLATGEGQLSRSEFRPLFEAKGVSIVQPDVVKCGGITEICKIANMAEVYNVEVAPHQCYGPIAHVASLAAMSVCPNFLIHEWEAADDALYQELTNGAYPVQKDGYIQLPEGPGLGIEVNFAEFVKRHPFTNYGAEAVAAQRP
jgi:galactonate dehydratase